MTEDGPQPLQHRLAALLSAAGVTTMFGLPGGGPNLDVIGAAIDRGIRFVLAHGETNAAIMAATHGLLTDSASPVVVTRGPGAASVVNGAAQATLDRYPLLVLTDTVPARMASRIPHQRLDQRAMLGPAAKGTFTLSDRITDDELAQWIRLATSWPCGAVHLDYDPSASSSTSFSTWTASAQAIVADLPGAPSAADRSAAMTFAEARRLLAEARRPVVIVGMEAAVSARHDPRLSQLLASAGCPILTTYQAVGVVPTEGGANAGLFTNGALERPVLDAADLIVTVGLDPVEPIPAPWTYDQPVIRVSSQSTVDPYMPTTIEVIGPLVSSVDELLHSGDSDHHLAGTWEWGPGDAARFLTDARRRLTEVLHLDPERAPANPMTLNPIVPDPTTIEPLEVVQVLIERSVGQVGTVTVDAGAHFLAIMPLWPIEAPFELLISNGLATMGFALPAAIGAALATGRPVLALVGDGGLAMTLSELETVGRLGLPVTVVVFNDAALSLIEIKQHDGHGGPETVRFVPSNFAAVAEGLGIEGHVARSADELAAILDQGWVGPRLIDVRVNPADYRRLIGVTRG